MDRAANFYFANGRGIQAGSYDVVKDVTSVAIATEIIERKGAWYHFGGQKWQGKDPLFEAVAENPELAEQIRKATLDFITAAKGEPPE